MAEEKKSEDKKNKKDEKDPFDFFKLSGDGEGDGEKRPPIFLFFLIKKPSLQMGFLSAIPLCLLPINFRNIHPSPSLLPD